MKHANYATKAKCDCKGEWCMVCNKSTPMARTTRHYGGQGPGVTRSNMERSKKKV